MSNTLAPSSKVACITKYPFKSTSAKSAFILTTASGTVCPLIVINFVSTILSSVGWMIVRNRAAGLVAVEVVVDVTVLDVALVVEVLVSVDVIVEMTLDVDVVAIVLVDIEVDVVNVDELTEVVKELAEVNVDMVEVLVEEIEVEATEVELCIEAVLVAGFKQDVIRKIDNIRTMIINDNFFIVSLLPF
jgi:hypothetical protein